MMVWHAGLDAWKFDWISMFFDNDTNVLCDGGEFIDDEMSFLVDCI